MSSYNQNHLIVDFLPTREQHGFLAGLKRNEMSKTLTGAGK